MLTKLTQRYRSKMCISKCQTSAKASTKSTLTIWKRIGRRENSRTKNWLLHKKLKKLLSKNKKMLRAVLLG